MQNIISPFDILTVKVAFKVSDGRIIIEVSLSNFGAVNGFVCKHFDKRLLPLSKVSAGKCRRFSKPCPNNDKKYLKLNLGIKSLRHLSDLIKVITKIHF